MSNRKLILCVFDYKASTGFATVSQNIVPNIKKHFGSNIVLHICAINYFGETITEPDGTIIFSAKMNDAKKDDFGRHAFMKLLKEDDYDGLFIIQDLAVITVIVPVLKHLKEEKRKANKKSFKSIFYFPIDSQIVRKLAEGLEFFDTIITYTEYGRNELFKVRPDLKGKVKVIPHGTNTKDFYPIPLEDQIKFKKEYFGENANKFIIANINRNQPRKDIPNTIFAFIEAKSMWKPDWPKPFLYLGMNPSDPMGLDLRAMLLQTELEEGIDYMFPPKEIENAGASVEMLNKIYNSVDLYVTTTLAEGWGLSVTEAMACKLPVICPNHTSLTEVTGNGERAWLLDELVPFCGSVDNIIRQQTVYTEVAIAMFNMAKRILLHNQDKSLQKGTVEKAYEWVTKLTWDVVSDKFIEHFEETFKIKP